MFASLADAFDPEENADYAARFLRQLYAETGNWTAAAGLYHSRTPLLAASYRQAVALRLANTAANFPSEEVRLRCKTFRTAAAVAARSNLD